MESVMEKQVEKKSTFPGKIFLFSIIQTPQDKAEYSRKSLKLKPEDVCSRPALPLPGSPLEIPVPFEAQFSFIYKWARSVSSKPGKVPETGKT
jgi:hypothetical protein